jgi:outer membrane protein assembly factor BamB
MAERRGTGRRAGTKAATAGRARRLKQAAPRLLPGAPDFDPAKRLRLEQVEHPLPNSTLGDLGFATRVAGPDEFPLTILVQPYHPAALIGLDRGSVKTFRHDPAAKTMRLVANSGINLQFGFVWTKIRRPGVYAPAGLPRDRMLASVIAASAHERRLGDVMTQKEATAEFLRQIAFFVETEPDEVDDLRGFIAQLEAQTGVATIGPGELERGGDGIVAPFALPGGATLDEFRARLKRIQVPVTGLPEEELTLLPDPDTALAPPWRIADPIPERTPPPLFDPAAPLPWPWPPDPIPPPRWWGGFDPSIFDRFRPFKWWPLPPWWWWRLCLFSRNWWMHHRDAQHSGNARCSGIDSTTVGGLVERYALTLNGNIISMPSIANGKIYVGTGKSSAASPQGGTLYKIDLPTGTIDAMFTFSGSAGSVQGQPGICSSPAIAGGRVYISALIGKVYCLDANTLACLWVTDLRNRDLAKNQPVDHGGVQTAGWSSPLVVNGKVYVGQGLGEPGGAYGYMYCLDAYTGQVVWLFCTNRFSPAGPQNTPNVIPPANWGVAGPPPAPFAVAPANPPNKGASPWSSACYDAALNRIYIGTGNSVPDNPLPDPDYASGVLSLDASTGAFTGFFQPAAASSYRPADDLDVDVPAPPMAYVAGGRRIVAIGSKNGSFFLLDAGTMAPIASRQLLPYDSAGNPFPTVDPPGTAGFRENKSGPMCSAAVHYGLGRVFVGVGGYSFGGTYSIDSARTPFMRVVDWLTLADAWATAGANPPKYVVPSPPMYTTSGECGLAAPAVVNDVVIMATSKPGLYALDAATGLCLWSAAGLGSSPLFSYGPAVYRNYVVAGLADARLHVYSL